MIVTIGMIHYPLSVCVRCVCVKKGEEWGKRLRSIHEHFSSLTVNIDINT